MWEHLRKEAITAKNPKQFARNKVQDKTQYPVWCCSWFQENEQSSASSDNFHSFHEFEQRKRDNNDTCVHRNHVTWRNSTKWWQKCSPSRSTRELGTIRGIVVDDPPIGGVNNIGKIDRLDEPWYKLTKRRGLKKKRERKREREKKKKLNRWISTYSTIVDAHVWKLAQIPAAPLILTIRSRRMGNKITRPCNNPRVRERKRERERERNHAAQTRRWLIPNATATRKFSRLHRETG